MFSNAEVLEALRGTEIGGGQGYEQEITSSSEADVIVRSESQFRNNAPDSGKVIWIPPDERIELSRTTTVRATVASLSPDGSRGGLLYTNEHGSSSQAWDGGSGRGLLQVRGNGTLMGIRYRGPYHDHYNNSAYPGYIPLDSGNSSERARKRSARFARGMKTYGDNVEIVNCELYGWPNQAVQMGSRGNYGGDPHIHHNYGHDCMMVGFGYVVDVLRGNPLIEKNYFNASRHSVDGFGHEDCSYVCRDNVFGPVTYSHAVDMHMLGENGSNNSNRNSSTWEGRAGGRMEITNNTFLFLDDIRGHGQEGIVIRGVPKDVCRVEGNRFLHDGPPSRNPGSRQGDAWRQHNLGSLSVRTDSEGYANFEYQDNDFGLRSIVLPDGTERGGTDLEPAEPEPAPVERRRVATRVTNRPAKAAALRGMIEN